MVNYTGETLGIIGGCGVAAANELMCRMERKLTSLGCIDDRQQPEMILYQASHAPNRIKFASGSSEVSFVPYFIDVGKKLKLCGATLCCIACNTAHCAIDEIENGVGLPFVNIVTETLTAIQARYPEAKTIGILGSSGTKVAKIYQTFARRLSLSYEFVFPDDGGQSSVDDGIAAVKAGLQYKSPGEIEKIFIVSADQLIRASADVIVLGCTEIPLAVKRDTYGGKPIIDTISVLADACVNRCKKN